MAKSDMQIFNEFYMPATIETLDQMVNKFNQASGGSIILTTGDFTGDFYQESFFNSLDGAQRRTDLNQPNSDATVTDLTESERNSVKVAGGFGPVRYEPLQMTWLQRPTAQGIEVVSRKFAQLLLKDQLNTAILALSSAISNQPTATNDVSAEKGISYSALNNSHALFGDSSSNLVANVMNGNTFHQLVGKNLDNVERLFNYGTVNVVDILGKLVVVTDAPALIEAGTPNKGKVLSLSESAAIVSEGGEIISNIDRSNGKKRIEQTLQMDYSFNLGLKGYSWDIQNGGSSPTDAKLGTGSNWDKSADSIKNTAGTITIFDTAK